MTEAQRLAAALDEWGDRLILPKGCAAELRRLEAECEQLRKYKAAAMLMVEDADRYHRLRNGQNWPAVFANSEDPEPLRGAELDAAMKETK